MVPWSTKSESLQNDSPTKGWKRRCPGVADALSENHHSHWYQFLHPSERKTSNDLIFGAIFCQLIQSWPGEVLKFAFSWLSSQSRRDNNSPQQINSSSWWMITFVHFKAYITILVKTSMPKSLNAVKLIGKHPTLKMDQNVRVTISPRYYFTRWYE